MYKKPFRDHHLLTLLNLYQEQSLPLDLFIHRYFRENKALGSKDRAAIAETAYELIRWRGWLDFLCEKPPYSWERRLDFLRQTPIPPSEHKRAPLHIRFSCPKELFTLLQKDFGDEKAMEICQVNNTAAPLTVRTNTLKISREALLQRFEQQLYGVSACPHSSEGITFDKRHNFFSFPEFKEGFFEVQDEASQLVSALVEAKPGGWLLDYCAGAGGKTLAIAPAMQNKGQIFLHDIRPWALEQAQKRLKRAGVQNAQIVLPKSDKLNLIQKKMDWVLVDAPCSGTGTLRRNPDMKWKFSKEMVDRLVLQQREIFSEALNFLKPGGTIVYATCSVLHEENQQQVEFFLKNHPLKLIKSFQTIPEIGAMDGFFAVVFSS